MLNMGNKEKILIADDTRVAREGLQSLLNAFGPEHEIIGMAASVKEVEKMVTSGEKPTVALVDNKMPKLGDGEKAAQIIRNNCPGVKIIAHTSSDDLPSWGDENVYKNLPAREFVALINRL